MSKVLVPFANGFEEIEAMSIIDVLSRAKIKVVVAGLEDTNVQGANTGLFVTAHTTIDQIVSIDEFDMIVLPGGLPGAQYLSEDEFVQKLLKDFNSQNKKIAAICAAPWALKTAGILENKKHTNYPGFQSHTGTDGYIKDQNVVIDGNIITSQGPGTAIEFALNLVKILKGDSVYQEIKGQLLV